MRLASRVGRAVPLTADECRPPRASAAGSAIRESSRPPARARDGGWGRCGRRGTAEDFSALALNETLAKFFDLSTFAARDLVTSRPPPANPPHLRSFANSRRSAARVTDYQYPSKGREAYRNALRTVADEAGEPAATALVDSPGFLGGLLIISLTHPPPAPRFASYKRLTRARNRGI
jgi:hypothetical protein